MNNLKYLRERKGITQRELSDFLNLTPKAISFYELGQRDIPNDVLKKLADYFHVSTDYILGREEKQSPFAALPVVGNIIKMFAALSPQKQEQAASYIAFLAQDDKKA